MMSNKSDTITWIKEWAYSTLDSLKRYTFNSTNPKTPQRVEDVSINYIGIARENEGQPAEEFKIVGFTGNEFFEINQPDSTSTKHAMNGFFTDEETAISASSRYFNSALIEKINELKEKKAELEKEIEELEKELQ